jgi:hypothetical protein
MADRYEALYRRIVGEEVDVDREASSATAIG